MASKKDGLCYNCSEPTEDFRCPPCRDTLRVKGSREYFAEYRKAHREELRAYHRRWRAKKRETRATA